MVKKLTPAELKWCQQLNDLMKEMPKRLLLLESAGGLHVLDKEASRDIDLEDGKAKQAGVVLFDVSYALCKITSVSG